MLKKSVFFLYPGAKYKDGLQEYIDLHVLRAFNNNVLLILGETVSNFLQALDSKIVQNVLSILYCLYKL